MYQIEKTTTDRRDHGERSVRRADVPGNGAVHCMGCAMASGENVGGSLCAAHGVDVDKTCREGERVYRWARG